MITLVKPQVQKVNLSFEIHVTRGAWISLRRRCTAAMCKDFPSGFVAEIGIEANKSRGTITCYDPPTTSLMIVPGAGVQRLGTIRSDPLSRFTLPQDGWRVTAGVRLQVRSERVIGEDPGYLDERRSVALVH